jgi:hypothetical protein
MRRFVSFGLCGGFALIGVLSYYAAAEDAKPKSGADVEHVLGPWRDAVKKYQEAEEHARDVLMRLLDASEDKARAAGNADEVETLKQQRTQFEERGVLPASVRTTAYERSMKSARAKLEAVAKRVKTALLKHRYG